MAEEKIDTRVVHLLRWAVLIQIVFLALSTFSPRLTSAAVRQDIRSDFWSIIAISLMLVLLFFLSIERIEKNISRRDFLLILYSLSFLTIISRYFFSINFLRRTLQMPRLALFRWDAIFFLIIPLVFLAWQYSMREVVIYSIFILVIEAIPILLNIPNTGFFFTAATLLASLARSGIFLIAGWIENRLVQVQRSQQEQLMEANRKLRKYAITSEKLAQTQERNRIARELHDTLAHTLSSISVQLEAAKALFDRNPDEAKEMLARTLENTKNGLAETRRTLVDLRASELETYGLTRAIRNTVESAAERGGFKASLDLDREIDILPEDATHTLYRTVQESVENTLRHANAGRMRIRIQADEGSIEMEIEDDGVGFDPAKLKKEHFGIRGMRERVEMLGGTMKIESNPEEGTRIIVTIPRNHD